MLCAAIALIVSSKLGLRFSECNHLVTTPSFFPHSVIQRRANAMKVTFSFLRNYYEI